MASEVETVLKGHTKRFVCVHAFGCMLSRLCGSLRVEASVKLLPRTPVRHPAPRSPYRNETAIVFGHDRRQAVMVVVIESHTRTNVKETEQFPVAVRGAHARNPISEVEQFHVFIVAFCCSHFQRRSDSPALSTASVSKASSYYASST